MLREIKTATHHYFRDEQGRVQGEYKQWHDNGQLLVHCFYVDNNWEGEYKVWYCNGRKDLHCFYLNGELHGEYKSLYANGTIHCHRFYINNREVSFDELPYPITPEDRLYFTLKYNIPLLPIEQTC